MNITGTDLYFLLKVLEDSIKIQRGYDWNFKYKKEERKSFHEKFIKKLIINSNYQFIQDES